jgi:hypothetical protein
LYTTRQTSKKRSQVLLLPLAALLIIPTARALEPLKKNMPFMPGMFKRKFAGHV